MFYNLIKNVLLCILPVFLFWTWLSFELISSDDYYYPNDTDKQRVEHIVETILTQYPSQVGEVKHIARNILVWSAYEKYSPRKWFIISNVYQWLEIWSKKIHQEKLITEAMFEIEWKNFDWGLALYKNLVVADLSDYDFWTLLNMSLIRSDNQLVLDMYSSELDKRSSSIIVQFYLLLHWHIDLDEIVVDTFDTDNIDDVLPIIYMKMMKKGYIDTSLKQINVDTQDVYDDPEIGRLIQLLINAQWTSIAWKDKSTFLYRLWDLEGAKKSIRESLDQHATFSILSSYSNLLANECDVKNAVEYQKKALSLLKNEDYLVNVSDWSERVKSFCD